MRNKQDAAPIPAVHDDAITREDVIDCYKRILGRQPESEDVIRTHLRNGNYRRLVEVFLSSPEFVSRMSGQNTTQWQTFAPASIPRSHEFVQWGSVHNEVETDVTPKQLAACLARVKSAWTFLGEERPHHSVLTDDRYRPEALAANLDHFRETGQAELEQILLICARYGLSGRGGLDANELGCGVGRVTIPLAKHFTSVRGYDISRPHLDLAARYSAEVGCGNTKFVEIAAGTLPQFEPCDLFYSRIVLQHNPPPVIRQLIRAIYKSLRPEGIAIFQVPSYIDGYRFSLEKWLKQPQQRDMEMHCIPMAEVLSDAAAADCAPLEIREDSSTGSKNMVSNTYVIRKLFAPQRDRN
jgi:SAM-dependent methyltransferase